MTGKSRGQAAIEFLITNGWAILVVVILLAVLFYIGVLSPQNTTPNTCLFQPGFSCYTFKVGNVTGSLELDFGQATGRSIQVTGISCSQNSTAALHTSPLSEDITVPSGEHRWITGGTSNNSATCEGATGEAGARYKGQVCINYIESGTSTQRLVCGEINARLEPASAIQTPVVSPTPIPSNVTICDPYTPWPNGTLINASGSYALGDDLSEVAWGDCIDITASNVTLNCGGHSITGIGGGNGIYLSSVSRVSVSNCAVSTFNEGISLLGSDGNILAGNTASSNVNYGIHLSSSSDNTLTGNTVTATQSVGIFIYDSSDNDTLVGNNVSSNMDQGIFISGSGHTVTGNVADHNAGFAGIIADTSDSNFTDNTADWGGDTGFHVFGSGNRFVGNTADQNMGTGMFLEGQNNVSDNMVCTNAGYNFYCYSEQNDESGNICGSQEGCGITCDPNCPPPEPPACAPGWVISSCPCVLNPAGNYSLAGNLPSCSGGIGITVSGSGSTLDCHGYTITGPGWGYGIRLGGASGVSVSNCVVSHYATGILVYSSNGNNLTNDTASGNTDMGISLTYSNYNNITDSHANSNTYGIDVDGSNNNFTGNNATGNSGSDFLCGYGPGNYRDTDGGNTCDTQTDCASIEGGWLSSCPAQPPACPSSITACCDINSTGAYTLAHDISSSETCIRVASGGSGSTIDCQHNAITGSGRAGSYGLFVTRTSHVGVSNCRVSGFVNGIYLFSSNNNNVTGNTADSNNASGIYLWRSDYNNVTGNAADHNGNFGGIYLEDSGQNNVTGNTVGSNGWCGIFMYGANYNNLASNTANSNGIGIYVYGNSNDNRLTGNTANSNSRYGIRTYSAYGNNFTGNTVCYNPPPSGTDNFNCDYGQNDLGSNICAPTGDHGACSSSITCTACP